MLTCLLDFQDAGRVRNTFASNQLKYEHIYLRYIRSINRHMNTQQPMTRTKLALLVLLDQYVIMHLPRIELRTCCV